MAEDNILASNLAQLGGQISSTFQTVALQNQYKNALPGMQEAFKSAMTDFDSGKSGAGFSKIMAIAMENPNNPYIQNVTQMAFKAGQFASDDYFKTQTLSVARAKAAGNGVELTPEEIAEFENFGTKSRSVVTPVSGVTGTTRLPATQPRIGPDGVAIVPDVNAQEGLPTRTGNEPPQVDLTTPVDFDTTVTEMQGVGDLKPNQQLVDTSYLLELGIPIAAVIGPEAFNVEEPQGTTESMKLTRKGTSRDKSVSTKTVLKNTAEKADFEEKVQASRKAASAVKNNVQLKKIFESSGRNFDNISLDEEQYPDGKIAYSAEFMDSKGVTTKEKLSESEYNSLNVLKGIRDYVQSNKDKITVIAPKADKKELSAADKVRQQFGKPKDDSTKTPPPPERTSEKTKAIDEKLTVLKEKELVATAGKRKERIAQIDREIEQLARLVDRPATSTSMYPTRRDSTREKSQFELQESRKKILELEEEREKLLKVK